jgi:hypothetical protein
VRGAARAEVAAEFDAVHSVERAFRTNSVDEVIEAGQLRPTVAAYLLAGVLDLTNREPRPAGMPAASA